jgi:hypothetical protein
MRLGRKIILGLPAQPVVLKVKGSPFWSSGVKSGGRVTGLERHAPTMGYCLATR